MILLNTGIFILILAYAFISTEANDKTKGEVSVEESQYGVKYATKCEVCKYMVVELEGRLEETGKTHEVIETGYSFDGTKPKKRKKYTVSELRLVESLEELCDRLLTYNIHKERKDSTRFAKGTSQTFQVLNNLVAKGVKVELGIPQQLWDKPSAEITNLKTQCESLMEEHESDIENWYFHHQQDSPLMQYLCEQRVLKAGDDRECLYEKLDPKKIEEQEGEKKDEL